VIRRIKKELVCGVITPNAITSPATASTLPRLVMLFTRNRRAPYEMPLNAWLSQNRASTAARSFPDRDRAAAYTRTSGIDQASIPSSFAAVPPRIAMRSSSLRPGIDMM